jgi:4-hydroxybenzoate polyprenyltransferase/geranylgeranylglycerol-phosphate geranylgeranyltransferase
VTQNQHRSGSLVTKVGAHIEAWRPYTVIWCGLVSLVGACLAFNDFPPIHIALLVVFIPMMGWIAGLYLSDYLDRELDRIQKPHRPIPSGRITPREAVIAGFLFAFSGFLLTFLLSVYNVILVFVVALLVFGYARLFKARGLLGNLNRGIVIIAAYFFGVFAAGTSLQDIPFSIWILAPVFFIHDTNSNLVGAIRDIQGDQRGGYQTFPVKYGIPRSMLLSIVLMILYYTWIAIVFLIYDVLSYPLRFLPLFLLALFFLLLMYLRMNSLMKKFDRHQALQLHEFYVAERITLASAIIIGMVSSLLLAGGIFILAFTITLGSQYFIRKKYEFVEDT